VQPMHLKVVTLTQTTSLTQMVQQEKSPVSLETLAIINQIESNMTLRSGERVKTVTGLNPGTQ
jgi:predicted Zn-dependent protease